MMDVGNEECVFSFRLLSEFNILKSLTLWGWGVLQKAQKHKRHG